MDSFKIDSSRVALQPGFTMVIVCLMISSFLGIGIRIVFSENRLRHWVLSAVEPLQDEFDFELGAVRLSLADYWLPRISIELESLRVESTGRCGPKHHISLGTVKAPLDLGGILRGKIQFKTIEVSDGQWIEGESVSCDSTGSTGSTGSSGSSGSTDPADPADPAQTVSQNEVKSNFSSLSSYLKSVRIRKFVFVPRNFGGKKIQTKDLVLSGIERLEGPILIKTNLQLHDVDGDTDISLLPEVTVTSELFPTHIKGEIRGRWKEGELKIDHHYDASQGSEKIQIRFDFQNIPVIVIQEALRESGWWSGDDLFPKQFWVSFKGELAGPVQDLMTLPVRFEYCKFTGDLGEIEAQGFSYHPHQQEPFSAMQVEMKKVDLKSLLAMISVGTPTDQYGAFGRLDGKLDYVSTQAMQFHGSLEGLELIFSNGGIRRSQIFRKIEGALELKDQRFSALIEDISLEEGTFKGILSFNFGHNFSEGLAQIRIDELSFSPVVQKLMIGGQISSFAAYGQIQWENDEIAMWRGDLAISKIDGGDWRLHDAKIGGLYQKDQAEIKVQAEKFSVRKGSQISHFLQPLLLDQDFESDFLNMERFTTKMVRRENSLEWQRATVFIPEGRITLSSEGGWDKNDQLSGWISSDFPELKLLKWTLGGDRQNPRIMPHTKWLKELARKKQVSPKKEPLKVIAQPKVESEGLEKMGKAVIEGAKELFQEAPPSPPPPSQ